VKRSKSRKRKKKDSQSSEEEEEKDKKKGRNKKRKSSKKKESSSSSSGDEESVSSSNSGNSSGSDLESSSSNSDSSGSSSCSSSSNTGRGKNKNSMKGSKAKGRKKKEKGKLDLDLLEELWPVEDRPATLRSNKAVMKYKKMSRLLRMRDLFMKEQERKGVGVALFGRDKKPRRKKFKAMKDDGEKSLHPARFVGMPRVEPGQYWKQVPVDTCEIYRHLPLQHLGVEGVQESTIVKLHNRRVPVDMDGFWKDCKDAKQVQMAVFNYVAVLRSLHPGDYSGLAVMRVLIEAGWAEGLGNSEKQKVLLMKRFFDDVAKENSGRAVRQETPLDYEQVKSRWVKAVAAFFPQFSLMQLGQQQMPVGSMFQKPAGGGGGGGGSGGGAKGQRGQNSGQRGPTPAGGAVRTPARYNGLAVCFGFNSKDGCKRPPQGNMACKDGNSVYAHVCNFTFRGSNGQPDRHCLAVHPRFGNH
jgi:hypothetical protein